MLKHIESPCLSSARTTGEYRLVEGFPIRLTLCCIAGRTFLAIKTSNATFATVAEANVVYK
jgi:hypothetical protein